MAEHKRTIIVISWHPQQKNLLASASNDGHIIVWDVFLQRIAAQYKIKTEPVCIDWVIGENTHLSFISGKGPLYIWKYAENSLIQNKEVGSFSSEITKFRWHSSKIGKIALGHSDGSISVIGSMF